MNNHPLCDVVSETQKPFATMMEVSVSFWDTDLKPYNKIKKELGYYYFGLRL